MMMMMTGRNLKGHVRVAVIHHQ